MPWCSFSDAQLAPQWQAHMTTTNGHCDSATAFAREIDEIQKRRPAKQQVECDLVGLAISGGGIGSATFGLGALQGLRQTGLLKS